MRRVSKTTILPLLIPLAVSGAFAAPQEAPLAPGKRAGVKQAQNQELSTPLLVMGAAAVGIGIALAVSGNDNAAPATTTTTGTGP
ncbi:MAG TPA: hypothetical protein VJP60_02310 [Rhizomicrobium sp.]|nr:hypothetical protein [Rhizomicrobium sp.]